MIASTARHFGLGLGLEEQGLGVGPYRPWSWPWPQSSHPRPWPCTLALLCPNLALYLIEASLIVYFCATISRHLHTPSTVNQQGYRPIENVDVYERINFIAVFTHCSID